MVHLQKYIPFSASGPVPDVSTRENWGHLIESNLVGDGGVVAPGL